MDTDQLVIAYGRRAQLYRSLGMPEHAARCDFFVNALDRL